MNVENTNPGFSVPDVRRDVSFDSTAPQFDSTSARGFPSAHHAAASLPISAEPKLHQR